MKSVKLLLDCEVDPIPSGDANCSKFVEWCEKNDVHPIVGERRAWCRWLGTYLHDAAYIVYYHAETFLITESDYQNALFKE